MTQKPKQSSQAESAEQGQLSGVELAALEKEAAKTLDLGNRKWYLLAAVILFFIGLLLPHVRGISGWHVLTFSQAAADAKISFAEYCFYILATLGVGVFTLGTLIFKRTWMSYIAWILSCIALVYAVFAIWMRQTATGTDRTSVSIGMMVMVVSVALAVLGLSNTILARSDKQKNLVKLRRETPDLDAVAQTQRELFQQQQEGVKDNPLLIDDRRERAARRNRSTNTDNDSGDKSEPDEK